MMVLKLVSALALATVAHGAPRLLQEGPVTPNNVRANCCLSLVVPAVASAAVILPSSPRWKGLISVVVIVFSFVVVALPVLLCTGSVVVCVVVTGSSLGDLWPRLVARHSLRPVPRTCRALVLVFVLLLPRLLRLSS